MRNRFSRLDAPPTSSTCDAPTPNVSASNATHASFARPACGGAATRTLSARPCRPTTAVRPAPGCTWTWSTTVTSPGSPARSSPAPDMTNRSSTMGAYCRAVPFGPVDPQVDLVALEEQVLARWRELDLFDQVKNLRKGSQPWVFYEGPPTANGSPGLHHVWARVFKDLYPRFQTMRGRDVPRKGGWDCHGLPVELEIEKELGFHHKDDIEVYGIAEFNDRCRESVQRYVEDFAAITQRAAVWIDTKDAYWTLSNDYIESVWWLVRRLWGQGLLYEGHRVVPYCARCGTALSSHEVALGYRDVTDPSVYVRFPLLDDDADLLVWTTTPCTLVSNVAAAVGSDIAYVRVRGSGGGRDLIMAEARAGDDTEVVARFAGRDLVGRGYVRPFDYLPIADNASRVVAADFVSTDDGSGIVHLAPAFGADDMEAARVEGLPV